MPAHRRLTRGLTLGLTLAALSASSGGSLPSDAPVEVADTISTDTTFTAGTTYVITRDVVVEAGATLTIQPGAVVKFNYGPSRDNVQDSHYHVDLIVRGSLVAQGTKAAPITLTSIRDDAVGGDTTGDGSGSRAGKQAWGSVMVTEGGTATLTYATIKFADSAMDITGGAVRADHVTVQDANDGIVTTANDFPVVSNLQSTRVGLGGVVVNGGQMTRSGTWGLGGAPVTVVKDVSVEAGATLTVKPGTVVKFNHGPSRDNVQDSHYHVDLIVKGNLVAQGTKAAPITFTSIRDDAVGGDLNGDGSGSRAGKQAWGSVMVNEGGRATLTYVTIKFADFGMDISDGTVKADQITVQDANYGIVTSANDFPTIAHLQSVRVTLGGVAVNGGQMTKSGTWGLGGAPVTVLKDVSVESGATLTIRPGTVVKFNYGPSQDNAEGGTYYVDLLLSGRLIAQGTKAAPITFTSVRDDALGGDTNGDSGGSRPGNTSWGSVVRLGGQKSTVAFVAVRYASALPKY